MGDKVPNAFEERCSSRLMSCAEDPGSCGSAAGTGEEGDGFSGTTVVPPRHRTPLPLYFETTQKLVLVPFTCI